MLICTGVAADLLGTKGHREAFKPPDVFISAKKVQWTDFSENAADLAHAGPASENGAGVTFSTLETEAFSPETFAVMKTRNNASHFFAYPRPPLKGKLCASSYF